MTPKQVLATFLVLLLVGLSVHEYWGPELKAIVG